MQTFEGFTGAGERAYEMAHSYGAGCWQETLLPAMWAILRLLDYPYNMALASPRLRNPRERARARQKPRCFWLLRLRSHTPSLSQYPIGYTSQPYLTWGVTKAWTPGGRGHWGHLGNWVPQSLLYNWSYYGGQRGKVTFLKSYSKSWT